MCVYDAISYFNYGAQSIIDTLVLLHVDSGFYTTKMASGANVKRKYNAGYKGKIETKQRRKVIRGLKKKRNDTNKHNEGKTYESGGF